jgi:hypothetical protein
MSTMNRCIRHTYANRTSTTWCGRSVQLFDTPFTDINHAAYSAMAEDRVPPCPECLKKVAAAFGLVTLTEDDARKIVEMDEVCASEGIGPDVQDLLTRIHEIYP